MWRKSYWTMIIMNYICHGNEHDVEKIIMGYDYCGLYLSWKKNMMGYADHGKGHYICLCIWL